MSDERGIEAGMGCERAQELLPRYLDGELTEAQSAALRRHLMACTACRRGAAEGRALQTWMVPLEAPEVPEGFAQRVVTAALAGETGPPRTFDTEPVATGAARREFRPLDFVVLLTGVAAAALFALSIALGMRDRPSGDELSAQPLSEVLLELEALNAAEQGSDGIPGAADERR